MNESRVTFVWEASKLSTATAEALHAAAREFSEFAGEQFRPIRLLFGKYSHCKRSGLLFFRAGTGARPANIVTIAIGSGREMLCPAHRDDDFAKCCTQLSLRSATEIESFRRFLIAGTRMQSQA